MTTYDHTPAGTPEPGNGEYAVAVLYLDDHLRITYTPQPASAAVRLIGELDAANHRAAADTLRLAGRDDDPLVIDCENLSFVDVAGLRMLIDLCRDGRARIDNPPAQMLRLLQLIGLTLG
ncbi:STAS domain-containing protein [Nonomuraea dietziae]|uniref:STAS domain-containing protein n=1 Tax=Nonomuraea dietziae TaxID=65515 RepID=UPI0033CB9F07